MTVIIVSVVAAFMAGYAVEFLIYYRSIRWFQQRLREYNRMLMAGFERERTLLKQLYQLAETSEAAKLAVREIDADYERHLTNIVGSDKR